jgi:hypothetical protein
LKLLTKAIEAKLLKASNGDTSQKLPIIVKFFNPTGAGTWYITSGEQVEGDWIFFGLCDIHEPELGYVALSDLRSFKGRFGLGIERDLHFDNKFLDTNKFPVEVIS